MSILSPLFPLSRLQRLELVVVTGKGGVGKTTVASALALLLARTRRVTLLEVDPRESAHRLFEVPPSGGEPVSVADGLELLHTRPRQVVDEIVSAKLKIGPLVRRLQASPIYDHFVDGAPGLKELALLRFVHDRVRAPKSKRGTDCVVLDSPATGHALSLLSAPGLVAEAIATGPIAGLADEVATWLQADSTGFVLVTLAEELPVTETLEAAAALEDLLEKPPEAWIANALYPPVPPGTSGTDPVSELWRLRRAVNERELARLERSVKESPATLPLLPIEEGRALVEAMAKTLEEQGKKGTASSFRAPDGSARPGEPRNKEPVPSLSPLAEAFRSLPERLVFVGSGGVGKTTLAAAMAARYAAGGERTLVMTFDPSLRLKDTLGIGRGAAATADARDRQVAVALPDKVKGHLHAHLLDARRTFDRLIDRYAPDEATRQRILGNRFFRHLAGQLAGILEYMAVERLYEAVESRDFDRIILDTPPTREALEFLDAPQRIVDFLDSGALQVALKPWFDEDGHLRPKMLPAVGRPLEALLDRMVGIDLLRDMAEFFQAFAPLFDGFRERATAVDGLLRSAGTGFVLVTAAAQRNLPDTMFFARNLTDRSHDLVSVVANRVHPADDGAGEEVTGLELMRWLGTRDQAGVAHLRGLLESGPPVLALPQLPASPADLERLLALGGTIETLWMEQLQ